jgi:hypothetical protein
MIRYKEKVSEEFKKEADISINDIENLLESEIEFESERAVKLIEDLDKKSEYLEINLKND